MWPFVFASVVASPGSSSEPLFSEIGARALPGVETVCGSRAKDWILEVNGGGVLLGDFDGDRRVDVVIVDGSTLADVEAQRPGRPARLFLGNGDCTFRPAPESWTMKGGRWGMGGATGDFDGDGWLDIVVTEWGSNRILLNDAGKGWREISGRSGLSGEEWSTSAAVFDYDRDQKLDLVIVNYLAFDARAISKRGAGSCRWKGHDVMCGPEGLSAQHAQLWRGRGDGTFENSTVAAKLVPPAPGFGLGAMTLDYDLDGDTDLYVANDSTPNLLWENQGDGTFKEVAFERGVSHDANGKEQASMGIAAGDLNGDGRDDLFVTNFSGENNVLYASTKKHSFRERSSPMGLAGPSMQMLGWGTSIGDFDLDGDLDLAVFNGHVYPQADERGTDTSYAQPAQLYRNDGQQKFAVEPLSDAPALVARASAAADLDADGDLDLVALRVEGQVCVFQNRAALGADRHWLRVRLESAGSNRAALGARVRVELEGRTLSAEIRTSGGFQAAVPAEAHFGLGAVARVPKLSITWPSGRAQVLNDVEIDRVLVVREPEQDK